MFGQFLKGKGYDVKSYHAGMGALKREEIQDWFSEESGRIVVATVAFGMGIDVSDIRFVCHMDLPKNIESYYQEIKPRWTRWEFICRKSILLPER